MAEEKAGSPVPGIKPGLWAKLSEEGYDTPEKLSRAKVADIDEIDGFTDEGALKVISAAQAMTGIGGPGNALAAVEELEKAARISTNSVAVDLLFADRSLEEGSEPTGPGGLRVGSTYEIAGVNGHGKSQFAAQMVANAIAPVEVGGLGRRACWVDTEHTGAFAVKRIEQMLTAMGVPARDIIKERLDLVKCENTEMQVNIIRRLLDGESDYGCLVVDGLMTMFRSEFRGRETLGGRADQLNPHLRDLNNFAMRKKALVMWTNQVMDSPDAYGGGPRAIGGNIAGHGAKYRIFIRKAERGAIRIVRLDKATDLPEGEAPCVLTSEGFTDRKKEAPK